MLPSPPRNLVVMCAFKTGICHEAARTDKLAPVCRPERPRALQRKDADVHLVRARVHQHVQVEPLEQRVVRSGVTERYETSRNDLSAAATRCVWPVHCVVLRACEPDEPDQDRRDLLQAVVTPERYLRGKWIVSVWTSEGVSTTDGPPSSTVMLFVSVWTTQSWAGPQGLSSSCSSELRNNSTKGDRRMERYGVINNCRYIHTTRTRVNGWVFIGPRTVCVKSS